MKNKAVTVYLPIEVIEILDRITQEKNEEALKNDRFYRRISRQQILEEVIVTCQEVSSYLNPS